MQERLDRHFYRDRYDYRRTLVEFARELSSETDLDTMLSLGGRAAAAKRSRSSTWRSSWRTSSDGAPRFQLKKAMGSESAAGRSQLRRPGPQLPRTGSCRRRYLFFERTRHQLDAVSQLLAGLGAQDHRRSGPDLLPALHGPRPDHRLPRA